jgi:hypothetical protein
MNYRGRTSGAAKHPRATPTKNNIPWRGGGILRYYTVTKTTVGNSGGRYGSHSGATAAKKAASKRFSTHNKMRLTVRETGTDREYMYTATRVKLPKPVRTIAGVTITSPSSSFRVEVVAAKAQSRFSQGDEKYILEGLRYIIGCC